jgi:hypothetical protein
MSFVKLRNVTNSADVSRKGYNSVLRDESANLPPRSEIVLNDPSVNATSLGIAHLVIRHTSSPWFYQQAVALM